MKRIAYILTGLLFIQFTSAQTLKGRIIDIEGQAIPLASIYIKEIKQGLIGDNDGFFQIKLKPGTYHLECSCIGYETKKQSITMTNEIMDIELILSEKIVQLQEVVISMGEDPAYAIMRKAIEKAPYYQSVVKESVYKAYTKGSGKLLSSPKMLEKMSGEDLTYIKDKIFIQESVSEYKFTAPDKYEQTVLAYSSTFPSFANPEDAMAVSMISLYQPMYGSIVSPLNPKSFSYYHFRYEGYEEENGQIINKIRIIPKLKDPKFPAGILHIADDEWNIRYAEFSLHQSFLQADYRLNYHPVINDIYLVTDYLINTKINALGIKINMDLLTSIQYSDIQLNDSLIAIENTTKKPEKKKKELEIKEEDSRFTKTVDSIAVHRDSLYWSEVRTAVLNEEERMSYVRKDSVQAYVDSINHKHENSKFGFSDLIMGGSLGRDSSFVRFQYSGLLEILTKYNFVDGFWLGQSFSLDFKRKKNTGFLLEPSIYWASAREALIWKTDLHFDYAPRKLGQLHLSAGKFSEDYSGDAGINRTLNSIFSLDAGRNYARFYEKTFGRIYNEIDIANGLQLGLEAEYADRQTLVNHTAWNIFGVKKNWPNTPNYGQSLNETYSRLAKGGIRLQYRPEYYYRIVDGKKHYLRSKYPFFVLNYQQGVSGFSEHNYSSFSMLELSINQILQLGIFDRFAYGLVGGKFFNKNPFNYMDYKHFNSGGNIGLTFSDWDTSYALLPLYTYSTNKNWIQAFATYQTDYLLIKRLPFLQGKLFTESLHAKFLYTPEKKYYSEWGYSVDLFANTAAAGVFVSFDAFRQNAWGVQVSLPLFQNMNRQQMEITIGD